MSRLIRHSCSGPAAGCCDDFFPFVLACEEDPVLEDDAEDEVLVEAVVDWADKKRIGQTVEFTMKGVVPLRPSTTILVLLAQRQPFMRQINLVILRIIWRTEAKLLSNFFNTVVKYEAFTTPPEYARNNDIE